MRMNLKIKPETPADSAAASGCTPTPLRVTCSPSSALRETSRARLEENHLQQEGTVFISECSSLCLQATPPRSRRHGSPAHQHTCPGFPMDGKPRQRPSLGAPSFVPPHPVPDSRALEPASVCILTLSLTSWDPGQEPSRYLRMSFQPSPSGTDSTLQQQWPESAACTSR